VRDERAAPLRDPRRRAHRADGADPAGAPRRGGPGDRGRGARSRQGAGVRDEARHREGPRFLRGAARRSEIDAIYNPLPNGLHCEWTIKALRAGKDVLCEKPIASNADEAQQMADAARDTGRKLVEAFHWRYHPLATRVKQILASGEIGAPRHYEVSLGFPIGLMRNDIRWQWDLAGGTMMDLGCYTVSMVRHLAGPERGEPIVDQAKAWLWSPQIDRRTEARFHFADGRTAAIFASMWSTTLMKAALRVTGESGELRIFNPIAPHIYNRLTVRGKSGTTKERVAGETTYVCQLRAFVDHVRNGTPVPTGPDDAVANMRVIDAIYRAAGLKPRAT
jgi:predicted dehydrogenase